MKTVISIVLIISISLLTVMLPIQFGSITTDVSASSSMFIGTFSTAFLAWLIAMLAGLGITIGSLADFNEILSTPAGTSFMNDAYTLWNQQSDLFKVGTYMGASQFINFRNMVKTWINSDDTSEIVNADKEEYVGYRIESGKLYYDGIELTIVQNTDNPLNYSYGLGTDWDSINTIINNYCQRQSNTYEGSYRIVTEGTVGLVSNYIRLRDADNNLIYTYDNRTARILYLDNYGWNYFARPVQAGFVPDINGNMFELVAVSYVAYNLQGYGSKLAKKYSVVLGIVKVNDYKKPYINWDAGKIAHDLTQDHVAANDTVSVSVPSTLREQLTDAFTNQSIAVNDVVMPQVQDVPITSTNQYITNNIITNTQAVAIPDLDFDFPELDSFRLPSGITTKFPFSIPFDVGRAFDMMVAPAQAPVFVLPFAIQRLNIHHDITLDLTEWESVAEVVRWFLLAIFILILVVVTRKLIKG